MFPWWIKYPNVNNEIQNLDWLLYTVKHLSKEVSEFINLNTIKYADPILWDITRQYEANTVVVDGRTGDAFISTQAVPSGVQLNRTEYWTRIYAYSAAINTLREQIAIANEEESTTASAPRAVGNLVWLNGILYRVIAPMIAGDSYVIDSNCVKTTIEDEINRIARLIWEDLNTEIQNRIDGDTLLQNSIDAINNNIHANKTVLIGDSYNVNSVVSPTWGDVVSEYLGNCISYGYGARGFANSNTFYDAFSADLSGIADKELYSSVIVCAGANDVGQSFNDIKVAISNFKTLIESNFINAKLKIGFIGWSRGASTSWNTTYKYYKRACEELGIEYLNGVEIPLHNTNFLQTSAGNTHHPNADGSRAMGKSIVNAMLTGSANYEESGRIVITQSGTHLIPSGTQYIWYTVKNGLLTIKCDKLVYGNTGGTASGTTPLNNDSLVEIGSIGDGFLKNLTTEFNLHSIECSSHLYDGTKSVPVSIAIWGDGHIGLRQTSGTNITNGFGGYIGAFTITLPICELA